MNRATPQMRNFANRLIAYETSRNKTSGTIPRADSLVSEKLRPALSTLMGNAGFRALLARALVMATEEAPWLHDVHVAADGTLEGLEELHSQLDPDEFFEGKIVLLAHLLGLLVAFIGENLTLRLIRDIWPKVPLNNLTFGNQGKNEKTK